MDRYYLRAIASEFPLIYAAQRIPDDARADDFVQGQRNIPLLLLKKVDAIAPQGIEIILIF